MKKYINIIILLFSSALIFAGTDGTIRGRVTDIDGSPLIGAQIYMPALGIGTTADTDGNFIILNINVGDYEVKCQMIGYQTNIMENVHVTMDQTTWLNFTLPIAEIEGDVVRVTSQKRLVEKGSTSKKITMSKEAIETLPIKNVSDLYNLQAGVVKVESNTQGIPDHEERGLEEVHVRGGRSGEIAYMIDGMYIRNPIFGGIGNGTRLNKFAIREFDWQPGGFNAEYGDAMSAVSNLHTMTGGNEFSYKFQYETSLLGKALGSRYDDLRDYHDYNFGIGGSLPFYKKIKLWVSGQSTTQGSFSVYKFDDYVYQFPNQNVYNYQVFIEQAFNPNWNDIKYDFTWPWDNISGYRGFGFDRTDDYFAKVGWEINSQLKLTYSYWDVAAHRKTLGVNSTGYAPFIYWNDGKNELFRDTERHAFEINHTINKKSFYTIRVSKFVQEQFIGVRLQDSDNDGYPDWFEWKNAAGYATNSDPYNWKITPHHFDNSGETIYYDQRDGNGPDEWTSGWYYGAKPGNYNWLVAEDFTDYNENGLCDNCPGQPGYDENLESEFDFNNPEKDVDGNGLWRGPALVQRAKYRDGDYWLTPEMYVDYANYFDAMGAYLYYEGLDPTMTSEPFMHFRSYWAAESEAEDPNPLYFRYWEEENIFGGTDKLYSESTAETNEIRFDFTSQVTNRWRARFGVDYKTHKLNFYELQYPWNGPSAFQQRFAEQWDDVGIDNQEWITADCRQPDYGEGNGVWDGPRTDENPCFNPSLPLGSTQSPFTEDFPNLPELRYPGESYDDFNGDGKWNNYVEPEEFAAYFQNTYEVPWMVVNLGVRLDAVQYNTKIWADDKGEYSPYNPYYYFDCGTDLRVQSSNEGNVYTSLPMCPDNNYALNSGFTLDDEIVYVPVEDNFLYHGFEIDVNTGLYVPNSNNTSFEYNTNEDDSLFYWNSYCQPNSGVGPDAGCTYEEFQNILVDKFVRLNEELDDESENGYWDEGESTTDNIADTDNKKWEKVIFKKSKWLYKISPRLGISHVIADGATFTFNYGIYYQTPIYEFIYRNVSKLENPSETFEAAGQEGSTIGNATMGAGRTQSYELAFNIELSREWAFSAGIWVKDMDMLTTADEYSSGAYKFKVAKNGDFGTAIGFDFTVQNRGKIFNSTLQYTYSTAKASSEYDAAAFGAVEVDAAKQEFLMPYDRTHDLTLSVYTTKLPFGFNGGLTAFYQSGQPYTGIIFNGSKPESDLQNKYGLRAPDLITMDMSLSKEIKLRRQVLMLGMNVYNLFDKPYPVDVYAITGNADYPGEYYEKNIGEEISGSYYDRPWMYSSNREINFFIRIDFN